jgi:hypothetical protein
MDEDSVVVQLGLAAEPESRHAIHLPRGTTVAKITKRELRATIDEFLRRRGLFSDLSLLGLDRRDESPAFAHLAGGSTLCAMFTN